MQLSVTVSSSPHITIYKRWLTSVRKPSNSYWLHTWAQQCIYCHTQEPHNYLCLLGISKPTSHTKAFNSTVAPQAPAAQKPTTASIDSS